MQSSVVAQHLAGDLPRRNFARSAPIIAGAGTTSKSAARLNVRGRRP
jgi:hypothetical protein